MPSAPPHGDRLHGGGVWGSRPNVTGLGDNSDRLFHTGVDDDHPFSVIFRMARATRDVRPLIIVRAVTRTHRVERQNSCVIPSLILRLYWQAAFWPFCR